MRSQPTLVPGVLRLLADHGHAVWRSDQSTFRVCDHRGNVSVLRLDPELLQEYFASLDPLALKPTGELTEEERWGLLEVYVSEIIDKDFGIGIKLEEWGLTRNSRGAVEWFVQTNN